MRKLTDDQVVSAIEKYQSGLSLVDVGKLFGVSGTAIDGLLRRRGIERRTLSLSHRRIPCNHHYFDEPLDESRAYWIGFFLADGCILEKTYGFTNTVAVVLARADRGHLVKLRKALKSKHAITDYRGRFGLLCSRFAISSTELATSLQNFNVLPRKSADHLFSDKIPKELLHHYFRGYFDGNGFIGRHERSKWAIGLVASESFLNHFLDWVGSKIPGHRPSIVFSDGIHRVTWSGTHRCLEILSLIYSGSKVHLNRKKALFYDMTVDAKKSRRTRYKKSRNS